MDFVRMRQIALNDVKVLAEKGKKYGDSWKKRGGIGAFMMLARKMDRMELAAADEGYDIFQAIEMDGWQEDGLLDDIADLRRYLFLVETHMRIEREDTNQLRKHLETTFSEQSFEEYDKRKVDALNDITDKEALLSKVVEDAKWEEPSKIIGGPQAPLLDKAYKGDKADAETMKAPDLIDTERPVPIYIDFIEQPDDIFKHLHAVKASWMWTNSEDVKYGTKRWPESHRALMCPARSGTRWLYKGDMYIISEDSGPVIVNGKWVWEVLAFPDESTTMEPDFLKNKADDPGLG